MKRPSEHVDVQVLGLLIRWSEVGPVEFAEQVPRQPHLYRARQWSHLPPQNQSPMSLGKVVQFSFLSVYALRLSQTDGYTWRVQASKVDKTDPSSRPLNLH